MKKENKLGNVIKFLLIVAIAIGAIAFFRGKGNTTHENVVKEENKTKDLVAPVLEIGDESIVIAVGNSFDKLEGVTANDDIDGDISSKVTTEGELDTQTVGNYELKYVVSDNGGNKVEKTKKIEVREKLTTGLPVLMYHFFYDATTPPPTTDGNFIEVKAFEEQLKYLKDNNYYFPTWTEVEKYVDKEINLPAKSLVITVDDGDESFFKYAVPLLQKYDITATSFVIGAWYGWRAAPENRQKNVSYQSHSYDMHESGAGGEPRMKIWSKDKMVQDIQTSYSELNEEEKVFCYPFGQYNDTSVQAVKDAGSILAFTTEGGKVFPGANKYLLPRVRIYKGISLNTFISRIQ